MQYNLTKFKKIAICGAHGVGKTTLAKKTKKRNWIDKHMLKAFRAARPRLLSVWPKLKEKGWTRKDLFRAGTLKYPHGDWGIAWSSVWLIPGMRAHIGDDGVIVFKWRENNGKVVKQTARPKAK